MITNESKLKSTIFNFYTLLESEIFVEDKSGTKMLEIINASLTLNPRNAVIQLGPKKTNVEYCVKELKWYISESLSILGYMDDIKIWNEVCSKTPEKLVNSNYGWCIFSKDNGYQYKNCVNELMKHRHSRRAVMIYTRPSMWTDYNKDGIILTCFLSEEDLEVLKQGRLVQIK